MLLGVSHSTVLRRLEAAESALGSELFVRRPDGRHELTPAGQDAFDTSEQLEELVAGMERRIRGRDLELAGSVRVTMLGTFLPVMWPDLVAFSDRYPQIDLAVTGGYTFADLSHREADVALRVIGEPSPDLVGRKLATCAVGVYGSAAYLATKPAKTRLRDHDFIGWSTPDSAFSQWITMNVPGARIRGRIAGDWQIEGAVNAGVGVTIMPCMLGDSHPDWRRVQLVEDISAPVWVLTHRDLRATVRMRTFRDYLADCVIAKRDLIEGRCPVTTPLSTGGAGRAAAAAPSAAAGRRPAGASRRAGSRGARTRPGNAPRMASSR
jgi:DNA-binding transcriptional LysR family regulator